MKTHALNIWQYVKTSCNCRVISFAIVLKSSYGCQDNLKQIPFRSIEKFNVAI